MQRTALRFVWIVLLVSMPFGVLGSGKVTPSQDYWMGLYKGSEKIGDMHVTIKPDRLDGKAVFRRQEVVRVRTKEAGRNHDYEFTRDVYASQGLFPVLELVHGGSQTPSASLQQPVSPVNIELRYGQASIAVSMTKDGETSKLSVPLSKEDRDLVAAGCAYDFCTTKLAVGQKSDVQHWYLKMKSDAGAEWHSKRLALTVLRREKLDLNGVTRDAFVVSEKDKTGYETIRWQTAEGEIIKQEVPKSGLKWVRETESQAASTKDQPS